MDEPRTPQDPQTDQPAPPAHRVRRAGPGDVAAMHAMVVELAEHERSPQSVEATAEDLHAALFGGSDEQVARAHVAEVRDAGGAQGWQVVGTAVWFFTYSTWTGRAGVWLEDLYVRPDHRGLGLGSALLAELAATCVGAGHRRLEWTVLDWNTPAQGVYRSVGAAPMEDWTTWRLDGDALEALAATAGAAPAGPPGDPGSA